MSDLTTSTFRESPESAEQLLNNTIYQHVAHIEQFPHIIGFNDPFFVVDIEAIRRQHDLWVSHLPFVRPFYAVKCNTNTVMLRILMQLGVGFDCASVEEMHTVLSLGADPGSIIFANPCKAPEALAFAYNVGVRRTTFDNLDELDSINKYMPNAQLMLRIFANDNSALVALGDKYGAPLESTQALLVRAKRLGMNVVGTSFHIGSGASDPAVIRKAVEHSRVVWDIAESLGFSLRIVDIGGGFQSTESAFEKMAVAVSSAISEAAFPEQTTFIAEPGRFYARSAFTLVCKIIARRVSTTIESSKTLEMLYQNDGIYGNFMNGLIEKEEFMPTLIRSKLNTTMARKTGNHTYKIWGPTCDSTDCVSRSTTFGCEVKIGDFLVYKNMGAYTSVTATNFNGFSNQTGTIYICSSPQDFTQIEESSSEEGTCSPMSTTFRVPTVEL
ncbi:Bcspe1 [Botrytis cinerea B05.10]|uniref:ornithine decarboxylase n=2 Tax=Botryotinia fuckeliana TaxID=40559 RepID=A0A384JJM3_BOTFB|nr:Bcspe1 [Botrytis cinerea B05.10]ATZ50799.1 Bcspe1 [Botrytis cinerea B05.10]CCD48960.1 similar to ornithine decarboxylase [Botrytis cinerea T4]